MFHLFNLESWKWRPKAWMETCAKAGFGKLRHYKVRTYPRASVRVRVVLQRDCFFPPVIMFRVTQRLAGAKRVNEQSMRWDGSRWDEREKQTGGFILDFLQACMHGHGYTVTGSHIALRCHGWLGYHTKHICTCHCTARDSKC